MTIEELLSNRTSRLVWVHPYEGIDSTGKKKTCVVELSMSVQDAIDHTRSVRKDIRKNEEAIAASDWELLVDFMLVNWASEKQ